MAIKGFKKKLKNIASGETLGDVKVVETKETQVKEKPARNKPAKGKVSKKPPKMSELEQRPKVAQKPAKETSKDTVTEPFPGYKTILEMAEVRLEQNLDLEFNSSDIDYVQFSQTVPEGFDYDEVSDFLSRVKYNTHKLEIALKQRNDDLVKLAREVKAAQDEIALVKQDMYQGDATELEKQIEENVELQIEINTLQAKLANAAEGTSETKRLLSEIEALKSENEYLRYELSSNSQPNVELPSIEKDETFELPNLGDNELPALDDDMDKLFDSMLDDIGGL